MDTNFSEIQAQEALEKGYDKAKTILADEDKLERFLQRLEKKMKVIPLAGDKLADIL